MFRRLRMLNCDPPSVQHIQHIETLIKLTEGSTALNCEKETRVHKHSAAQPDHAIPTEMVIAATIMLSTPTDESHVHASMHVCLSATAACLQAGLL